MHGPIHRMTTTSAVEVGRKQELESVLLFLFTSLYPYEKLLIFCCGTVQENE
jgi:hypothetical protein